MTFIVSEVGSNWLTFDDCIESIKVSAQVGASAVKFQMYTHTELYGYPMPMPVNNLNPLITGRMPGELPREWIPKLASACDEHKIEFMCTAFSPEGYRFIDPYVKRHKIASAENSDAEILAQVQGFNKPILMSTGGSSLSEIKLAVDTLQSNVYSPVPEVTLMYCVSAYPAKNVNLETMTFLSLFSLKLDNYGYSCHTDEWVTPVMAANNYRAAVIEKHFKVRPMYTPDSDHSILPDEFKKMVDAIRGGLKPQFPDPQEEDMVKYHKRRYIKELGGYFRTKKPENAE